MTMKGGTELSGKNDVEALEQIMGYILSKGEAESIAKSLIEIFGSFSGVFDAPEGELELIDGVSSDTADYLRTFTGFTDFYMRSKNSGLTRVFDSRSAYEVLKPKFFGRNVEAVALLMLDGRGRVIYNEIINEGSVSEVPVYIRRVIELCLKYDSYTVVIAHNHPSGNPAPSKNDLNVTRDIEFSLAGIDVELFDHIIIAGEDYMSMKSSEWLKDVKKQVKQYREMLKAESEEVEEAIGLRR